MKCYEEMAKRLQDGSISFTVNYKLKSESELFLFDNGLDTVVISESDGKYIIRLGLFIEKLPFDYADEKIKSGEEAFWKGVEKNIINYILTDYYNEDDSFKDFVRNNNYDVQAVKEELEKSEDYVVAFCDSFYGLTDYFDSWAVINTDDKGDINKIILRPKEDKHIETINWE